MRVVYMGTPEFSVFPLKRLVFDGYQVMAVYTQPDTFAGRGRSPVTSPVKQTAVELGLAVEQPANFKNGAAVDVLKNLKPDVIVVAAFGQILPQAVLDIPRYGCINIHPSLLPEYRGASPVPAAILGGDDFTGVSIMLLDAGMDTGPVLTRAVMQISSHDTTGLLTAKLSVISAGMLLEVLPAWIRGEIKPRPQDSTRASYCRTIKKEEGEIDWQLPAVDIWRRIRAFQPWPECFTRWQGKQLKIIEANPVPGTAEEHSGRVTEVEKKKDRFGVTTGEGVLEVLKVQLEGKRVMTAGDFMRGQRDFTGTVLPG
ncbi:methionyl-tRNA formyltransferase [Chloroflexota bacterium]